MERDETPSSSHAPAQPVNEAPVRFPIYASDDLRRDRVGIPNPHQRTPEQEREEIRRRIQEARDRRIPKRRPGRLSQAHERRSRRELIKLGLTVGALALVGNAVGGELLDRMPKTFPSAKPQETPSTPSPTPEVEKSTEQQEATPEPQTPTTNDVIEVPKKSEKGWFGKFMDVITGTSDQEPQRIPGLPDQSNNPTRTPDGKATQNLGSFLETQRNNR